MRLFEQQYGGKSAAPEDQFIRQESKTSLFYSGVPND